MRRLNTLLLLVLVPGSLSFGCEQTPIDSEETVDPERRPIGKADAIGSCMDTTCDGPAPGGNCWCDERCAAAGDCCADYAPACEGPSFDPFDPASCAGPPLSNAEAFSLFEPGSSSVALGAWQLFVRERTCNQQTGCSAWVQTEWSDYSNYLPFGSAEFSTHFDAPLSLRLEGDAFESGSGSSTRHMAGGCTPTPYSAASDVRPEYDCHDFITIETRVRTGQRYADVHPYNLAPDGKVTADCFRFADIIEVDEGVEVQVVLYGDVE